MIERPTAWLFARHGPEVLDDWYSVTHSHMPDTPCRCGRRLASARHDPQWILDVQTAAARRSCRCFKLAQRCLASVAGRTALIAGGGAAANAGRKS